MVPIPPTILLKEVALIQPTFLLQELVLILTTFLHKELVLILTTFSLKELVLILKIFYSREINLIPTTLLLKDMVTTICTQGNGLHTTEIFTHTSDFDYLFGK
jgi:hypothetical protein